MSKIEIIGHKDNLYPTLEELQKWGKLHIDNIPIADFARGSFLHRIYFDEAQCKERDVREAVEKALDEIVNQIPREIYHELNEKLKYEGGKLPEIKPDEALSFAMAVQDKLQPLIRRNQELTDEMSIILEYKSVAKPLIELLSKYELERRWEIVGITISKEQAYVISLLKEQLEKITSHNYAVFPSDPYNDRIVIIIGYERLFADEVEKLLFGSGVKEMPMPTKFRNRPLNVTLALMKERLLVLPSEVEEIKGELQSFFLEKGAKILLVRADNQDHLLRFKVSSKFAHTKYTFVIRGWAPTNEVHAMRASLEDKFQGLVVMKALPIKIAHEEHTPVVLRNPKALRPFERLVSIYALPMYGTVDPTSSLSFFFPIFFGVILGDVGYGMLLAIFAGIMYALARGRQYLKDFSLITFTFSGCSIIFGFLYGELFGVRMGLKPLLPQLARGHANGSEVILNYLFFAVSFGVLHIFYGIVLGLIVSVRKKNITKALEDIARIIMLFGITFIVCKLIHVLPSIFFLIGISFLIISITFLLYAGGILASLEVSTLIGNILSYCRLMALGMGSVYITFVGDELNHLIENAVLGTVVLVIVHAFNLVIHIAIPTVHALRLHYVEFFTKFFVPGGKPYLPLKKTETIL
ncbi:MAG: V-type ATP synthase subunit I [Candidatus Brocadiales bacterium]